MKAIFFPLGLFCCKIKNTSLERRQVLGRPIYIMLCACSFELNLTFLDRHLEMSQIQNDDSTLLWYNRKLRTDYCCPRIYGVLKIIE